jgi:hypothetical protein
MTTKLDYQGRTRNPTGCTSKTAFLLLMLFLLIAAVVNM